MAASDRDVLPSHVKPQHYSLHLYDLQIGGDFAYSGIVTIELAISEPTETIVLNAKHLEIKQATISGQDATSINHDERSQRSEFVFNPPVAANSKASIEILFKGTINDDMAGFYRSKYEPLTKPAQSVALEGGSPLMFSTQFESCDARRAFPCFDEPNLKASFDLSLEVPEDQVALSNMPESGTRKASKPGLKVVTFERTPKMSTYLLAWAIGELAYIETATQRKYDGKQLPVRVYTTPGYEKQGQLGADVCAKVVDFYSDLFDIEYPLPKIDLLATGMSHNAMENWGLITYRNTAILYDPKTSDAQYKKKVAYVVAHELAHQWFGNLVTMDWWSELWLNEGFATWVGWHAVDNFFPEFESWSQFVAESVQTAQKLDSLRSSHPVEVDVRRAEDVEQIFDAISYLKGSSVIRMLVAHLGQKDFFSGIAAYLKKHAYGNATTNDLWAALSEASGKDVKTFMDAWIRQIGFPVITVADEPGQIGLKQSRFLSSGDVKDEEDKTIWWVPVGLKGTSQDSSARIEQLSTKEETLRRVDESFYKLNQDQVGFYRTNYPPTRLAQLGAERDKLSVEDRIGLVADAAAMAISGQGTTAGLLTLVENFQQETSYAVWTQLIESLTNIRSIFADNANIAKGLTAFVLRLTSPGAETVGWAYPEGENFLTGQLRALLIAAAGSAGHQNIITEAKRQFTAFVSGDKDAIHPSLRTAVFRLGIRNGGQAEYSAIKNEFRQTTSIDGKEVCLTSLGQVTSADLAYDYLKFIFSDSVATQDIHFGTASVAANAKVRDVLWDFVTKEWSTISQKLAARPIFMDRFIKTSLSKFAHSEMDHKITAFFDEKDTTGWDRSVSQVKDSIKTNASYRERDEGLALEWLQAHGYV